MTEAQATEVMEHYQPHLPELSGLMLHAKLKTANPSSMDRLMHVRMKNRTVAILLAVFLGNIGVARFYLHDFFIAVWRIVLSAFVALTIYIELKHFPYSPLNNNWVENSWFGLAIISSVASFAWYIADIFMVARRTKNANLNRLIRFLSTDK